MFQERQMVAHNDLITSNLPVRVIRAFSTEKVDIGSKDFDLTVRRADFFVQMLPTLENFCLLDVSSQLTQLYGF